MIALPQVSDAHRSAMRDRLLVAAAAIVAKRGYAALTIRDILAEADVAPSTLYAYFTGKAEIVQALMERALSMHRQIMAELDDPSVDRLFARMVEGAFAYPFPAASVLAELRSRVGDEDDEDRERRVNEVIVSSMRPLLERMLGAGSLRIDDPDALVEFLDLVHDGMVRRASAGSFATSYERVGRVCLELLAGVSPVGRGRRRRDAPAT